MGGSTNGDVKANHRTASGSYRTYLWDSAFWLIRFLIVVSFFGLLLAIPVIVYRDIENADENTSEEEIKDRLDRLWVYNIFQWLMISWIGLAVFYLFGTALPYIFRFVARYVNPAHARYWRILRVLRRPFCLIGLNLVSYIAFLLIAYNPLIAIALGSETAETVGWVDFVSDVLEQCSLWAVFYLFEKLIILYITIHYHFRSDLKRLSHSKDMQNAVMALYEASVYLYPIGTAEFTDEDIMIGNATGSEHGEYRVRATRYLSRMGIDTYSLTSFFGNFLSSDPKSHWIRPASTYATVERAMANPKSAAALAKRIWMSMVPVGKDCLKADDIAEVLGPFRKEEAQGYFKVLDQNDMGDIRLEEMEWTLVDAGKIRASIYKGMHNSDHCINTLDWILLLFLGCIMVLFIMIEWVPSLKEVQETVKFFAVGLAFAVGRSIHHFLSGVVFILFDHPYDVGDRIELWSGQNQQSVSLFVERQSLLYTVFRRVDTWKEMQVANEWLQQCRIENVTRSGSNRQAVSMSVDIRTSFKDLALLRTELEAFLKHPDNKRDYMPVLGMNLVNVNELNKLDLRIVFIHRTNHANEPLRAARSNKILCAMLAAIRKIQLQRPDGGPLGQGGRPLFNVMLSQKEADERIAKFQSEVTQTRVDNGVMPAPPHVEGGADGLDAEQDPARAKAAAEAAEAKRRAEREQREFEERKAMGMLGKPPAVPHKGPPLREAAQAVSSGVDAARARLSTGMRMLPHFRS
ncbi:hypothetical protein B0H67DRAFT_496581 [Lasiosphaeris hirsuta]|uniref:Mechanosensitive ion channel protein Msy1/2-like transmembrane domain-containing protein n=1 Tax=Lasiosphaeris hirsuta TaxID=260670 RepID=A0AA40A205_9PEZI|nr:hypothetical protein B0H67DRAFT_496581 [Lasiosphaeris hirsuta]